MCTAISGKTLRAVVLSLLATSGATPSYANDAGTGQKKVIDEIVVTAQRRAESARDVPVALSAFQASDIEKFNVVSFQDIAKISPAITFGESNTKMFSTLYLRGVGTYSLGAGVEPSVSVVVDGVPVVQQAQALSVLHDIERIEVLKGPQGTLFGKNASAGVINVVTKDPTEAFEGGFEQTVTTDAEYITRITASGPLSDRVGYRVNAYVRNYDGYIDDIARDKTLGDENAKALRGKLSWDITDNLDLRLVTDYSESTSSGNPLSWQRFDPARAPVLIPGIKPGTENTEVRTDVNGKATDESLKLGATLNYQWQDHTITYLTSVSNWENFSLNDSDFTDFNIAGNIFGIPGVVQGIVQSEKNEVDQFLQELRITSPSSDTFEYMAGVFFKKAETERIFDRFLLLDTHWNAVVQSDSKAVFGQAKWGLADSTYLTVGARYNWISLDVSFEDEVASTIFTGDADDSAFQGKISLQNYLTADVMVYGSYTRGYKGPGFDVSSGFDQSRADNPAGEEISDSYEIGMKGTFLDNRMQLNITLFDTVFKGFQAQTQFVDIAAGINDLRLNNVGELETKGVEIESAVLLGDNFIVNLNVAYTDAVINEFRQATCYPVQTIEEGCINGFQDLSGEDLSQSPDWKYTLSGEYTFPFHGFDGFANFAYTWQDDVNFTLVADPKTVQSSYGILNIGAGIEVQDKYALTLFVNNVLEQEYAGTESGAYSGLFGVSTMQVVTRWERYAGLTFKLFF